MTQEFKRIEPPRDLDDLGPGKLRYVDGPDVYGKQRELLVRLDEELTDPLKVIASAILRLTYLHMKAMGAGLDEADAVGMADRLCQWAQGYLEPAKEPTDA